MAIFASARFFAKGSPGTMNKEYQELTNEYLKVCLAFSSFFALTSRSPSPSLSPTSPCLFYIIDTSITRVMQASQAISNAQLRTSPHQIPLQQTSHQIQKLTTQTHRLKTPNQSPVSHPKATSALDKSKAHLRRTRFLLPLSFISQYKQDTNNGVKKGGVSFVLRWGKRVEGEG